MTTSLVYLIKLESFQGLNSMEISSLTSQLNIFASILILFVQFSGIVDLIPPKIALLLLPITIGCGIVATDLFGRKDLFVVSSMIISTRVTSYALTKPSREALFGVLSNSDRIQTKPFVDTFICKLGTIIAAGFHSMAFHFIIHIGLLFCWFLLTAYLGLEWEMTSENEGIDETKID
jgi:hypothetical protein